MFQNKILSIVKNKKKIILPKEISTENVIIIDFFNIYCNIIKFNKYKTFSRETFILCLNLVLEKFKDYKVLIISKNIFEIEQEYLINITKIYTNITYIVVEDTFLPKGYNRERDDFTCILLQHFLLNNNNQSSNIITNDRYKNFHSMLSNVKPFNLIYYSKGISSEVNIDNSLLKEYSKNLINIGLEKVKSTNFNLI